jgi:phage shock protein PspC (stress-responsive transcriptional regulator)
VELTNATSSVDFDTEGRAATAVYLNGPVKAASQPAAVDDTGYEGFYRSSDDKMLAGVCAGLAHKWKVSSAGLRLATFLLTLFLGLHYSSILSAGSYFQNARPKRSRMATSVPEGRSASASPFDILPALAPRG